MKYPELAVIWVCNSKVELKKKTLRTDLAHRFVSLEVRLGGIYPRWWNVNKERRSMLQLVLVSRSQWK